MFIYVDILIITNIYADFLLIKSASAITHSPLKVRRGITAAVIGSFFSLAIFLPKSLCYLSVPIKIISAAVIVLTAFGYESKAYFFRRLFVFFLCAFIFGGLGTGIAYLTGGRFITARNGIIYADFSMPALVISSIAAYACIGLYKRLSDCGSEGMYTVIVSDCGRTASFKAMADTGNILKDGFTGKYVIVCPKDTLLEIYGKIPDCENVIGGKERPEKRWRIIPYSTISSSGMIAVICPKEVILKNEETGQLFRADVYLGAAQNDCTTAVFNPKILV